MGCGLSVPKMTESDIEDAVTIVAQMGPEPFLDAMEAQPDYNVVIGGRAYDPSPYVAFCMYHAKRSSRDTYRCTSWRLYSHGQSYGMRCFMRNTKERHCYGHNLWFVFLEFHQNESCARFPLQLPLTLDHSKLPISNLPFCVS